MASDLVFTFPLPENLANSRLHWRRKDRARRAYFDRLTVLRLTGAIPKRPRSPWIRAEIGVTLYPVRQMDTDNLMARVKWPVDWLVQAGYLVDDAPKHLVWTGLPQQVSTAGKERRGTLEITLTKLTATQEAA